ncbi:MAG: GNAT family N-acetyltransferase [Syntrophobacteraceae bacterium]
MSKIIDPTDYPGWDELILTANDYSFFHSSAWAKVLCESYGYKPLFFASASEVIPLMEVNSVFTGRRGVSLPFSDYCEPLVFGTSCPCAIPGIVFDTAKKTGWKYLEFRGQNLFPSELPVWSRYAGHKLKLSNKEALFSKLHANTLRNLKRAKASGLQIETSNSFAAMREYYRLHCLTRKRQAVPPQPFSFFRKVYEHIISEQKGRVILARFGKDVVAGAVFFHLGKKAIYKFGALDMNYNRLGASPAVMWEAISLYSGQGYDWFCFGRTDLENQGLRRFKKGFGAQEYFLDYRRFDVAKNAFVEAPAKRWLHFSRFFNHLPLSALKALGLAYKHFG